MHDNITVVITNWRRAEFLNRCLASVKESGFRRVVGYTAEPEETTLPVVRHFSKEFEETFEWGWTDLDPGNNECWLRAARLVPTQYMILLHDDDVLVPSDAYARAAESLDNAGALALWDGHNISNGQRVRSFEGEHGVRNTDDYRRWLLNQPRSVSPGCALWRTEHVPRVLNECATSFKDPAFFTRPTMMVGNDLMLHLRATDWGGNFMYFPEMPLGFGDHPGSETYAALHDPAKYHGLHRAYEATKVYFRAHDERKWMAKK